MAEFISEEQRFAYIGALLDERAGLIAAGAIDRVRQVEAELARVGHVIDQVAQAKPKRASARKAVTKAAEAAEVRNDAA